MMLYFVDSHIHISDKTYDEYLKLLFDTIISLNIQVYSLSENLDSSIKNINIKKKYFGKSDLFKTFVGIHPQYASLLHLESFSDFFKQNIDDIDGIGEIGLDPSYTFKSVVFHWYDGNKANLRKINDLGYYVSFGPYLLYSEDKKALLKECDLSLLLLETDGPVNYKRCFENVITFPTFIISLINFISIKFKMNFKEMVEII